jgi:hypothetical protein
MALEAYYDVYHNLENADLRMLLPLKVAQFPVLQSDAATSSETGVTDKLPICVGVDEVSHTSLQCCGLLARHDVGSMIGFAV